jgi:tight adherence protein B
MTWLPAVLAALSAVSLGVAVALWQRSLLDVEVAAPPRRIRSLRPALVPIAVAVAGFAVAGVGGAVGGVALALVARRAGRRRSTRARAVQLDEQLVDAVGALASAMRAGMSVPQALGYAAAEAESPLHEHLSALVDRIALGMPVADALATWVRDVGTDDAQLVGAALELHRRTGGDLPVVLDQVATTVRDRVASAREVRALTAQARLSGSILGLLPIGFFAFLWLTSRREMQASLTTAAGAASVTLGLAMEGAAFLWIRRLLAVER